MNISMQKTFLIKERIFKEISEGKGYLEYKLIDEKGDARVVTATACKGKIRKLSHIKAVYKRESPLVKALMKASVGDSVHIDFTKFNHKKPRSKIAENSQTPSYKDAYSQYSSDTAVFDSAHVIRLLGIAIIGFLALVMFKIFI